MTPAERKFKDTVRRMVNLGVYPSPGWIGRFLGRGPIRSIGGRETRWRRAVLRQMGWKERRHPHKRRFSWIPPRSWVPLGRRSRVFVFDPKDGYSR